MCAMDQCIAPAKLESIRVGNRMLTSVEAINRFVAALTPTDVLPRLLCHDRQPPGTRPHCELEKREPEPTEECLGVSAVPTTGTSLLRTLVPRDLMVYYHLQMEMRYLVPPI